MRMAAGGLALAMIVPHPALAQTAAPVFAQNTASALALVVQPLFAVIGTVIAGVLAIYVPRALAAFEARTRIVLTDQQRATVLGAVQTAAGMIETTLDQGAMLMAHVGIASPAVRAEAANAIKMVPVAAGALNMTVDGMARMIVGAVETRRRVAAIATPRDLSP